jgi:preprotein translocase subunit YajC
MNALLVVWLVVLVGGFWLIVVRPRRQALRRQAALSTQLDAGDEVVTIGGIYGTVAGVEGDQVLLEVADGVVIRVAGRAIANRVPTFDAEEPDEDEHEEDDDPAEDAAAAERRRAD